jgi:hypothetical protein
MNGAELGLGITTAFLSAGAIASSIWSASRSLRSAEAVGTLDRKVTIDLAQSAADNDLRLWQRTVIFPQAQEISDLLANFSAALTAMNLDKSNLDIKKPDTLLTHLESLVQLRQKIGNRILVFSSMVTTTTQLIEDAINNFTETLDEIEKNQTWLETNSFGLCLRVTQSLLISVAVTMAAEAGLKSAGDWSQK